MNKQQEYKKWHNDDGFSLIEVLMSLAIFSIGILGVSAMQLRAISGNSTANHLSEATVFASDQIEQMLAWDYDDNRLKSDNDTEYTLPDGTTRETFDGHQADSDNFCHAYWQVTDDTPVAGKSKTVDFTVYWDQNGRLKQFSLSTVKTK